MKTVWDNVLKFLGKVLGLIIAIAVIKYCGYQFRLHQIESNSKDAAQVSTIEKAANARLDALKFDYAKAAAAAKSTAEFDKALADANAQLSDNSRTR